MYDLQLAVNLAGWRIFVRRREDKAFLPVAERILQRDHYTCQYCGFQAKEYQEIINLDGNYLNNKFSNLATACCFCSQCLFLESVGIDQMSGGQLIYLPEMSQADLNSFCHVLFCAMGNGTGYQDTSQAIYRSFKFRSQPIDSKFGAGTSNPAAFGQLILEYQASYSGIAATILNDLRLLPSYTHFKVQLEAWAAAALEELAAESAQSSQ
ncbi:type IV secretion protein IcmJ [Gammaproteobacteria bacterium SCGC AG-212-F23]|nr:type IV secretion protein IcmJ [Gammaproteobacteria bacterium SCGC AG-212-F23]